MGASVAGGVRLMTVTRPELPGAPSFGPEGGVSSPFFSENANQIGGIK